MIQIETLVVGPLTTNSHLVYNPRIKKGIVVDPGDGAAKILNQINQLGLTITHLLLTHGHADHLAAIPQLNQKLKAKVVVHQDDAPMLKSDTASLGQLFGIPHPPIYFDITLNINSKSPPLPFGFQTIFTPGHSPGSVCFYLEKEGILFTGDTLFARGVGRTDLPGGDWGKLKTSLDKLAQLPPETIIYPGHGPSDSLGNCFSYLERRI